MCTRILFGRVTVRRQVATLLAIVTLLLTSSAATTPAATRRHGSTVLLDWNALLVGTMAGTNPFAQARIAAMTHLAIFEAVNAVTRDHRPYLGTLVASAETSAEAAAIAAAHAVLIHFFPSSVPNLDAALTTSLARIPDGTRKSNGVALGVAAAAAIIALRAADGSSPPAFHLPGSSDAGEWQLTPGCPPAGGIFRHWAAMLPFGLDRPDRFRSEPPPAMTSRRYAKDLQEVHEVGGAESPLRPQDRTDVARFYASVLAIEVWNQVARQIAAAEGGSLSDLARLFALLNMAISDGLVAVMETKYHYNLWRPETAIHHADLDGNPRTHADPAFVPLIVAPCFPSYPSAHAAASNAALTVLARFYGRGGHAITLSSPAVPGIVLKYRKLARIADDIDDARVYGGIHFRFDQDEGTEQGRRVGGYIYRRHLRPLRLGAD